MAITSTLRKLNVLSIYKTSLNTQIYFSSHPPKSLLCKVIRPQTHMLCVGKINVYDWQQLRTPANRNLCRICSSQSWERLNVRGRTVDDYAPCPEFLGPVCSKPFLTLHTAETAWVWIQAEPRILNVYQLLPQEQLESLRISKAPFHLCWNLLCVSSCH
jgi:hypothetical protein